MFGASFALLSTCVLIRLSSSAEKAEKYSFEWWMAFFVNTSRHGSSTPVKVFSMSAGVGKLSVGWPYLSSGHRLPPQRTRGPSPVKLRSGKFESARTYDPSFSTSSTGTPACTAAASSFFQKSESSTPCNTGGEVGQGFAARKEV